MARTQVVFPVSRELAIVGAIEHDRAEYDADDAMIAQINGSNILNARRQVYAGSDQFLYRLTHHDRIMHGKDLLNDECVGPTTSA